MSARAFTGVKVFSSTMFAERAVLGERVTAWIDEKHRAATDARCEFAIVDLVVTQSSDEAFHMIAITVFYRESGRPDMSTLVKPRRLTFTEPR